MQIHVRLFVFQRDIAIILQENLVIHSKLTDILLTVYWQALNCELPIIPVENFRDEALLSLRRCLYSEINQKVATVLFTCPSYKLIQIDFYFSFVVKKESMTGFKWHIFWDQVKRLESAWVIYDPKVCKLWDRI